MIPPKPRSRNPRPIPSAPEVEATRQRVEPQAASPRRSIPVFVFVLIGIAIVGLLVALVVSAGHSHPAIVAKPTDSQSTRSGMPSAPVAPSTKQRMDGGGRAERPATDTAGVMVLIDRWRNAWERRDIGEYSRCYSASFHSNYKSMDYHEWVSDKRSKFARYRTINVSIRDISIRPRESSVDARFQQLFRGIGDPSYADTTWKTLTLTTENGEWRIVQEEED